MTSRMRTPAILGSLMTECHDRQSTALNWSHQGALYREALVKKAGAPAAACRSFSRLVISSWTSPAAE